MRTKKELMPNRAITPEEKREVIKRLEDLWLSWPSLRLGQLIGNVYDVYPKLHCIEDYDLIETLEQFYELELDSSIVQEPSRQSE